MIPFLLGTHTGVAIQYLVYGFASLLFLRVIRHLLGDKPRTFALQVVAFLFLFSRNNLQWQSSVLSEGLIHSLTVASIAAAGFCVWGNKKRCWPLLGCGFSSLLLATRPSSLPLVIVLILFCVATVFLRGSVVRGVALLAVTLCLSLYAISLGSQTNDYWEDRPELSSVGTTRLGMHFGYLTAEGQHEALEVSAALKRSDNLFRSLRDDRDVPPCLTSIRAEYGCPHCLPQRLQDAGCASGIVWVNDHFMSWYARYLASNPSQLAEIAMWSIAWQSSFRIGGHQPWSPVPEGVERLTTGFASPFPIPMMVFWFGLVFLHLTRRLLTPNLRGRRKNLLGESLFPLTVLLAALSSTTLTAALMNTGVGRITRFGGIASMLALILLVAVIERSPIADSRRDDPVDRQLLGNGNNN